MFNSPESNPQQFFEYLPYVIAFGVEKKWKKQFENITLENPDWYVHSGNISSDSISSDISNISDAINSTITSSTSSSSGGGSSGGGSGGGGGGSW